MLPKCLINLKNKLCSFDKMHNHVFKGSNLMSMLCFLFNPWLVSCKLLAFFSFITNGVSQIKQMKTNSLVNVLWIWGWIWTLYYILNKQDMKPRCLLRNKWGHKHNLWLPAGGVGPWQGPSQAVKGKEVLRARSGDGSGIIEVRTTTEDLLIQVSC